MSCFCQNNRKVYFRASKAGELLTFLLLQNGPIHSTVNTNIYRYNILITLDLQFLQTLAVFCRTVFSFIFMKMRLLECGPSLSSFWINTFFCLVDKYVSFLGNVSIRTKKRICIDQDIIEGPHCTFLTLLGTGEYFYLLALFNSICFHQNFSIYIQ